MSKNDANIKVFLDDGYVKTLRLFEKMTQGEYYPDFSYILLGRTFRIEMESIGKDRETETFFGLARPYGDTLWLLYPLADRNVECPNCLAARIRRLESRCFGYSLGWGKSSEMFEPEILVPDKDVPYDKNILYFYTKTLIEDVGHKLIWQFIKRAYEARECFGQPL